MGRQSLLQPWVENIEGRVSESLCLSLVTHGAKHREDELTQDAV